MYTHACGSEGQSPRVVWWWHPPFKGKVSHWPGTPSKDELPGHGVLLCSLLGAGITSSCHCVLLLFMAILGIELGSVYLHENMFPAEPSPQPLFYYISIHVRGLDLHFKTH